MQPAQSVDYQHLFSALSAADPVDDLLIPLTCQIIGDHPAVLQWIGE